MEQAIKKAVEAGGYTPAKSDLKTPREAALYLENLHQYKAFLDPLFWKALSRSERLDIKNINTLWTLQRGGNKKHVTDGWQIEWHRFIDHLADGKDAESFFNELLK